jgi:hypothetical protein
VCYICKEESTSRIRHKDLRSKPEEDKWNEENEAVMDLENVLNEMSDGPDTPEEEGSLHHSQVNVMNVGRRSSSMVNLNRLSSQLSRRFSEQIKKELSGMSDPQSHD